MNDFDPTIIERLRDMARQGDTAPQMLREVERRLAPFPPHFLTLVRYLREAFSLSVGQVKSMSGWLPNGFGELSDSELNEILMPEIMRNRDEWDRRSGH